ncbi:MAG: zeta toxin family protein [Candidatus Magasanikbacteria bacterium]|nr:zeta toxin family protein [Candidatus Magasanikbacteria bacterium]
MHEEEIHQAAIEFARRNKKRIAQELTNPAIYMPDGIPISVFMAGSPGAGKTEFSKVLIGILEKSRDHRIIRIDGDEIRGLIPGYTGDNSHLFQSAVSLIVEKIHDCVLEQRQTFVLDGTFAKYDKAADNIRRSLGKGRKVFIFYLYQKPEIAWKFTEAREEAEGRHIPKEAFIEQFFGAIDTVRETRKEFSTDVVIFFVKKDFMQNTVELVEIEPNGRGLDDYLEADYTKERLENIL